MTKKHFEAMADVIKKAIANGYDRNTIEFLTGAIVAMFIKANPRFDEARFIKACGLDNK